MHTIKNIAFTLLAITTFACGDSDGETTVVTTVVTTSPGSDTSPLPGTTSDTDDETTETSTTEPVDPTSTGGLTTEGPDLTTGVVFDCTNEGQCDSGVPAFRSFCEYINVKCDEHQIEEHYCQILADKCETTIECTMCFELSNYCSQLGTNCDNLYSECGCVADATGGR